MKPFNARFYRGHEHKDNKSFFLKTWQYRLLKNSTQEKFANISQIDQAINNAIEFERMRIYLRSDVFTALVVVVA